MWSAQNTSLDVNVQKVALHSEGRALAYREVIRLWQSDSAFRAYFTSLLSEVPFMGFRWETPPITLATADRDFEYVIIRSDRLHRPADRSAFSSYFTDQQEVVTFPNLRRDALMIVPCPVLEDSVYGHLASFVREAPSSQVDQLWKAVGNAMEARMGEHSVWLSTAGMGVAWLHVRLDSEPKYYHYQPYRKG